LGLFCGQLEHEVLGKTAQVSLYGAVQRARFNLVKFGQVSVNHDLLAADQIYYSLDPFQRD